MSTEELAQICKLVAELTLKKLEVTPHLDIGNFSVDLFGRLLAEYEMSKKGHVRCTVIKPEIEI